MNNKSQKVAKIFFCRLFSDNYSYLVIPQSSQQGILIDPADPQKILKFLDNFQDLKISHVLYTHKHWDHSGNSKELKQMLDKRDDNKDLQFVASDIDGKEIDYVDKYLSGDKGEFDVQDFKVKHYLVPCHTKGHTIYHFEFQKESQINNKEDPQNVKNENGMEYFESDNFAFTGDTLFIGGCGKFFEGNGEQMLKNFDVISSLDDTTLLFCGHEYTKSNLEWAQMIDNKNEKMQKVLDKVSSQKTPLSIPSSVFQEKQINVFMQCHDTQMIQKLEVKDPANAMKKLRDLKDSKKGI